MTWSSRRTAAAVGAAFGLVLGGCTVNIGTPQDEGSAAPPSPPSPAPSSTVAATYATWIAATETGVALLMVEGCEGLSAGSGFLVAPDELLTAAHVVDGAQHVEVLLEGGSTVGTVIGFNRASDIALVKTDSILPGFVFDLAEVIPRKGDEVTALGYPAGTNTVVATQGRVSGLNQSVETETYARDDMIEMDAGINPGNSGGPLIRLDGTVVGVVSAGVPEASVTGFAAPAASASAEVAAWRTTGHEVRFPTCEDEPALGALSPSGDAYPDVVVLTQEPGADDVAAIIRWHGGAINNGDYEAGFGDFTPGMQDYLGGLEAWAAAMSPISWLSASVLAASSDDSGYIADVALARVGDPDIGGACGVWTKRYWLTFVDGRLLIDWVEDIAEPTTC